MTTTVAGLRLSHGGEAFDVFTDDCGVWTHCTYSIAALSATAKAFSSAITSISNDVSPVTTSTAATSLWNTTIADIYHLRSVSLAKHWTIPAPVQILPTNDKERAERAERFCHILLFLDQTTHLFVVVQYYTSATFLSTFSHSSPSPSSSTFPFSPSEDRSSGSKPLTSTIVGPHAPATHFFFNPLRRKFASMMHHHHHHRLGQEQAEWGGREIPLLTLSVSFTHIAWIEVVPVTRSNTNSNSGLRFMNINTNMHMNLSTGQQPVHVRRALRVVQFADMCPWKGIGDDDMRLETRASARELNIPARVLNSSYNIYLEPALASVFFLSDDSVMHKFRFA